MSNHKNKIDPKCFKKERKKYLVRKKIWVPSQVVQRSMSSELLYNFLQFSPVGSPQIAPLKEKNYSDTCYNSKACLGLLL